MRAFIGRIAIALIVFIVSEQGGTFALAAKPDASVCHGSGAKACPTPTPTATPVPTPSPTPAPTPAPSPNPTADPYATWQPPSYVLSYYGDVPFPYASEPQPAPRVYTVRERASLTWTDSTYGYSQIAHDTQSLGEDDYWDRAFTGYLAPGESANVRIPICQDPSAKPGWGVLCAGSAGIAAWYASSEPSVYAQMVTPYQGTFQSHRRATTENQGGNAFVCHAARGASFNGVVNCGGSGTWYTQPMGGTFWFRITNPSANYAPIVARVWAGMGHWSMQAYFAPREDIDVDIQPVDDPFLGDPRAPYPPPPVVDYYVYTFDFAMMTEVWGTPPLVIPNYP